MIRRSIYDQPPDGGPFVSARPEKIARGRRIVAAIRAGRPMPRVTDRALDLLARDIARVETTLEPDIWKASMFGTKRGERKPLTKRQAAVIQLLCDGLTQDQISVRLGCSRSNVQFLGDAAKFALDAATLHEAVAVAVAAGLAVAKPLPLYVKRRKVRLSARPNPSRTLSPRERQALMVAAEGASNAEIGASLGITEDSAKTLMKHASKKLGARNRAHAVVLALRAGEISL